LPGILRSLSIESLLDLPCGDGNWIRMINRDLGEYIGADIVPSIVRELDSTARENERFVCLDLVTDLLPRADAVLCRDALVHLSFGQGIAAISNIRQSGTRFLIATTFPGRSNHDITTGGWRPLDLAAPPFDLGPPKLLLNEGCTQKQGLYADKSLGVWDLRDESAAGSDAAEDGGGGLRLGELGEK